MKGEREGGCKRWKHCSGEGVVVVWMFPIAEDFPHQHLGSALSFMLLWGAHQIDKGNEMNPLKVISVERSLKISDSKNRIRRYRTN